MDAMHAKCLHSGLERRLSHAAATRDLGITEWVQAYCSRCENHHFMVVQ